MCAPQSLGAYDSLVLSSSRAGSEVGAARVFTSPSPTTGIDTANDAEWVVNGDSASKFSEIFGVADLNGDTDLELIVGVSAINTAYLFDLNEWF